MNKIRPDLDIILDILRETLLQHPASIFVKSLLHQYQERGSLSKKQLEGLHSKAVKLTTIPASKLATLEAIILKKPNRHKSTAPMIAQAPADDNVLQKSIEEILFKYPQHKRVLFLKLKLGNKELISPLERAEVERFHKLLIK